MEAARLRRRDAFEAIAVQAWQIVRVWVETKSRKRLPKLESLLPKAADEAVRQSPAEMRAAMAVIADQFGPRMRTSTRRGK